MLGDLGGDPGYEGTGHPCNPLAYHRQPILIQLGDVLVQPGKGAQAAEEAAHPREVGPDLDPRLQAPRLYQVGGDEAGGDSCGITDGGYEVKCLPDTS